MSSFTRAKRRVFYDWGRAITAAAIWARQVGRRYRIRSHPVAAGGWMWIVEQTHQPYPADRAERIAELRRITGNKRWS